VADTATLEVPPEEVKTAILRFHSLLDEQQRRLYAGLKSLTPGRGGDRQLAEFLDLDPPGAFELHPRAAGQSLAVHLR